MKRTPLKRKTPLKAYTSLKSSKSLSAHTSLKQRTPLKAKEQSARKLKEPYHSIFTEDMHRCYITGDTRNVDPHHIFGASRKELSERYGFMLPLRRDWHEGTTYSIHQDRNLELKYKILCEEYWINTLHKTKEEWIAEFGMWWDAKVA